MDDLILTPNKQKWLTEEMECFITPNPKTNKRFSKADEASDGPPLGPPTGIPLACNKKNKGFGWVMWFKIERGNRNTGAFVFF